ncbi:MAG: acetyl-CoA acetyltransferase [Chloroflexaceae bacterium]|nr:acetyl-CoA acetyltransferase [Chloroflexaceae bacterium]
MQHVSIVGTGSAPVGEHYTRTLEDLALEALSAALQDIAPALDLSHIKGLYVANAMGEVLAWQAHLGAFLANAAGLSGIEAFRVEAAGASGGVALRQATLAVAAGVADLVAVVGIEKATDRLQGYQELGMALATDSSFEAEHGITLTAQWAMLMRRYLHQYGYTADVFAPFPVNAHANGRNNPHALYRFGINAEKYRKATQVASPLNMLDCATLADGAAVVLLASEGLARELGGNYVRIAGSGLATDTLALHARSQPLLLDAARRSVDQALGQAHLTRADIDVLELTDPHGIAAALALESCGFVEAGQAPAYAAEGQITPTGNTPIATAGGYKARGDVGGATGVYQIVELVRQLCGEAGPAQVARAQVALAQCLGGVGSTAVTHILVAPEKGV